MLYLAVAIQGLLGANALTTGRSSRIEMSGVSRNANMGKLQAGYLFPEIGKRRNAFLAENPDAKIISLGIGDTTLPVPDHILTGLRNGVNNLGAKETYTGYGAEQGVGALRAKISEALYGGRISPEEF
jgi:LL-diaminopimelate aminotransferase